MLWLLKPITKLILPMEPHVPLRFSLVLIQVLCTRLLDNQKLLTVAVSTDPISLCNILLEKTPIQIYKYILNNLLVLNLFDINFMHTSLCGNWQKCESKYVKLIWTTISKIKYDQILRVLQCKYHTDHLTNARHRYNGDKLTPNMLNNKYCTWHVRIPF